MTGFFLLLPCGHLDVFLPQKFFQVLKLVTSRILVFKDILAANSHRELHRFLVIDISPIEFIIGFQKPRF